MKRMKKIVSMLLAVIMVLGMSVTAFAEGSVQVVDSKQNGSGSITIEGSSAQDGLAGVGVAGKTFDVYKVLDAEFANGADEEDGIVYKVPADLKEFYKDYFEMSESEAEAAGFDAQVVAKIAEFENDSEGLEAFAKAVLEKVQNEEIQGKFRMATVVAGETSTSVKVTNLPLGYYVIEDVAPELSESGTVAPVSALVLNTTQPDVTVKVKANAPSITKDIEETKPICEKEYHVHEGSCYDTGNQLVCEKSQHVHTLDCFGDEVNYVKYNNAAIGDTVTYRVTSPIPNMAGYTKYFFVVSDTMAKGLKFNNDVVIKIDGVELAQDKVIDGVESGYTVESEENAEGGTDIEIVLQNFIQYKGAENVGKTIEITYTAEVTKDVEVGTTGNLNEVALKFPANHDEDKWWDDTNPDKPKPDAPVGITPKQKVRTYVTGLDLYKVDATTNSPLAGAEFTIAGEALNKVLVKSEVFVEDDHGTYYKLKNGTYTETKPTTADDETNNTNLYESTTVKYSKGEVETVETEKINVNYQGTVDASGHLKIDGLKEGDYIITEVKAPTGYNILTKPIYITVGCSYPTSGNGEGECTWLVNTTQGTDGVDGKPSISNGIVNLTVENSTGALLPSTGGIGTTIFYVTGSILVLAAVVLLVTKKRMSAEK